MSIWKAIRPLFTESQTGSVGFNYINHPPSSYWPQVQSTTTTTKIYPSHAHTILLYLHCCFLSVKFIVIQPRFGSILGGTAIQVIGNNLRFNDYHNYNCHFDGVEVPGAYVASLGHIICTTPPMRKPGRINFCLSISSSLSTVSSQYCDQFFSCMWFSIFDISCCLYMHVCTHICTCVCVRMYVYGLNSLI